jgi:hypothetical protein
MSDDDKTTPDAPTPEPTAPPAAVPERRAPDLAPARAALRFGVWSGGAHPGERRRYPYAITGGTDYVDPTPR